MHSQGTLIDTFRLQLIYYPLIMSEVSFHRERRAKKVELFRYLCANKSVSFGGCYISLVLGLLRTIAQKALAYHVWTEVISGLSRHFGMPWILIFRLTEARNPLGAPSDNLRGPPYILIFAWNRLLLNACSGTLRVPNRVWSPAVLVWRLARPSLARAIRIRFPLLAIVFVGQWLVIKYQVGIDNLPCFYNRLRSIPTELHLTAPTYNEHPNVS